MAIVVIMLLFSLSIVAQTGMAQIDVNKLETLGQFESGHTYQIHIYNLDGTATAYINGQLIATLSPGQTRMVDITQYLTQGSDNNVRFDVSNDVIGSFWTYGFEILKDSNVIWRDECGIVSLHGCMGGDQLTGLVYQGILILPSQAQLFTFIRGTDNALWYRTYDGSLWGGWTSLGGILNSDPDSTKLNGDTYVFVQGTDKALWYQKYNGATNSWSGWVSLGGAATSGPGTS